MMKNLCPLFVSLLFISCSKSDSDNIQTVEKAINVSILKYETVDYKDSRSLGYPVKVIDVTFSEAEFIAIVKKIDLKNYRKEDNDFFKDFVSDSLNYHLAIFTKENKIRYSELD